MCLYGCSPHHVLFTYVEEANGIKTVNVKSGENGHKTVEYRERKEIPFGAANLLQLFGI